MSAAATLLFELCFIDLAAGEALGQKCKPLLYRRIHPSVAAQDQP